MNRTISIIIPVLNEKEMIEKTLKTLQPLRARGHEVIVVDGGSSDDSVERTKPFADRVIITNKGRSRQMNEGTKIASGEILLFLHADTFLPEDADGEILGALQGRIGWGRFDISLSGKHPLLRVVEYLVNLRSRLTGIATGDQAIFVSRELFQSVHGFPDIDLMEDVALSKSLKQKGRPICLRKKVVTSSRRWEKNGILRTILKMWYLRLVYFLGADPNRLSLSYRPVR